jgi:DNA polymerase-3 subunit chi
VTRIEFRIVGSAELHNEACRIARQAADYGQRVFILCNDQEEASALQTQIQRNGVFVAANADKVTQFDKFRDQLSLGKHAAFAENSSFINLSSEPSSLLGRFNFGFDLVGDSEPLREAGRLRYRYYRDRGYALSKV